MSTGKRTDARRWDLRSFFIASVLGAALAFADPEVTLTWVQDYLIDFSLVQDTDIESGRERYSTRLVKTQGTGKMILVYERVTFADSRATQMSSKQIIHYPLELDALDPASIAAQPWEGPVSGQQFWMVVGRLLDTAEYIEYTNVMEQRLAEGGVDITSSRGRIRTLALGYFSNAERAREFAHAMSTFLKMEPPPAH